MPSTSNYAVAAAALVAVGLGAGAYVAMTPSGDKYAECGGGVATGAASIGGPFTLTDHTGRSVTSADVIDKPTFVYFGYTFCPDVCPVDALNIAIAQDLLTEQGLETNSAFITIDPARDDVETLAGFVANLSPSMIGLTGSEDAIAEAAKAYRVYYQKAEGEDPEVYLMDHSAFIYLMDPTDGFLEVYRHGVTPEEIAESAACYVRAA